jgi:hypothetical protein
VTLPGWLAAELSGSGWVGPGRDPLDGLELDGWLDPPVASDRQGRLPAPRRRSTRRRPGHGAGPAPAEEAA